MNFDTSRKNYSGLAFVTMLHLAAVGIALKNSTILVSHPDPGPVIVLPPKPLPPEPKPKTTQEFDLPVKPVITEIPPEIPIVTEPLRTVTTTKKDDTTTGKEAVVKGGATGEGTVEQPHRDPVNVAAVIDAGSCAKPAYPAGALRNGDEGTVILAFLVGKDGRVASARIERTSGHRDLDRAALNGLSMCAFKPGTVDGVAYESWARMQYAWTLEN